MNITKKQLKQIINEEINEMLDSDGENSLARLLNHEDPQMVKTGIEIASSLNMPITIYDRPPSSILRYVKQITDPELLTLMSGPENSKFILFRIAKNQNTPIEVIYKMATDETYNIRAANYAIKSLELYCSQHPDDKICKKVGKGIGYRN